MCHLVLEIVSVEAGEEPLGVSHAKLVENVRSDSGGGGGSQSYEWDARKAFSQNMKLLVIWSEVMTPLRHAMSLE